ncbi:FG-GAP-like repeat-containing protein [Dyadobacter fermentans]|uniref:FG-GAP-like repeat-containing protein n=1 Tax=Dyadobacter fermentans TaxID=94254 RepID=UPI001CBBB77A|nr:FG-GAP-like repeat-containing protein [Dyadobacter fermentans]MBZ1360093.1 FG-GAP repeat protein [Dyadobacter fermentans]
MKKHYTIIGGAVAMAAFTVLLIVTMIVHNREKRTPSIRPHTAKPLLTNSPTGSTLTSIQNEIAKREYHITFDSTHHALQSPNRLHNLRAYYHPGKLAIQNRIDSIGQNFRMELVNEGIYADGSLIANADSDAVSHNSNDTLIITHPGFAEEFINNQAGIRQNFIITRAPAYTQQLSVHLSVHGLQARQPDGGHLIFYSNNSGKETDRLTYSDLKCWDAEGKPLTASIALIGKQIEINVDVANAAYPVTIDPIIANGSPANADKTLEINQSNAWLGFSVSTAGDVNGDGYSDVLVGAPKYDNGQADEGAAFLYPGTAGGISLAATVLECNQANAQMGYSVSNAGDIDKDGFSDIMVGVPYYDASVSNEGVVMIYKGSVNGLVTNTPSVFKLDQAEANLGIAVAMAGDVNGDGYSDMLAGAHQFDHGQSNEGVGVLILGAPNGLGSVTFLECNQANAMMGFAVAGAGDVDGDGFSDVMAGARLYSNGQALEGAAFVFKGSANGLIIANPTVIESNQVDARLGHALSSAGDVNGDGFSDIALGAYQFDNGSTNEGAVMIYYGSAIGINSVPSLTLESDQAEAQFGISVACAGDVNADGYPDLIVGSRYYDKGQANEGAAFIYQGSQAGLNPMPVSVLESNQTDAWLGSAVAPAGDVNGDGYADVAIGATGFSNGETFEGGVFIYHGSTSGLTNNPTKILESNVINGYMGFTVTNAGDVNGDGYGDIAVGSPKYSDGQLDEGKFYLFYGSSNGLNNQYFTSQESNQADTHLGSSIASIGDLNSDGYDDIIVGAISFGDDDRGAATIFFGASSGLNINAPQATTGKNAQEGFGSDVSTGGDINGDGYQDIVVGAPGYDNGDGAVYLFYGSSTGINVSQAVVLKGNQFNTTANMGQSVASAGDVNGDGYSDIVVGVPWYIDPIAASMTGETLVFFGNANGTNLPFLTIPSDKSDSYDFLGWSVSGAGDVNGDGYSDIITSAPNFDPAQNDKDAVFLYYGNPLGGTHNNLRLYNTDLTTPISHTQFPQNNFGAGLFSKSFTGRNKGKLVWETRPAGQGFSKGSNNRITNSTQSTGSQNAYSSLGTAGLELKNVIDKQGPGTKVRVRVKYDPVLALTGQSYGPWRYLPAYLMGNSTAPVPEEVANDLSETTQKKAIPLDGEALELATIYPNPVSNRLNIDFKDKGQVQSLKILTATGTMVHQSNGFKPSIDVSELSEGAYFLIITKTDGSLIYRNILINR